MSFLRKSPFRPNQDPKDYMLTLISREAEISDIPLSPEEKELLAEEYTPTRTIPDEFRDRVRALLVRVLEREKYGERGVDQRSFSAALEWVEPRYPNIAAFAEEAIKGGAYRIPQPLKGKAWARDRAQLFGFAIAVALVLAGFIVALSLLFQRR